MSAKVEFSGEGVAQVTLAGRLDAVTLTGIWAEVALPLRDAKPSEILVEASEVTYCDGAGVGLFVELRRIAAETGGHVEIRNLPTELRRLVDMAALDDPKAEQLHKKVKSRLPEDVGKAAYLIWLDFKSIIAFTGEMFAALVWAIRHPGRVRFRDVWMLAEKAGADALPVAAMLGWLIGSITAYQTAAPLRQFGSGSDVFIADIVAAAMIREMGPLITAILLAGRSGSAFAAEIGTMKVTEEINALTTLGLDPVRFLVVPRVLAVVLVTPLLSVFASFVGIAGGYAVFASMGYPLATFIRRVTDVVGYVDLLGGVFKAFVFALLIAGIGCLRGMQTRSGPGAVGDSTTRAVVAGIVLILITDGILGAIYFHLGI